MGITERRETGARGGPAEDPRRRPRSVRDRRLRAGHDAADRRGHRVLAHHDLPPLRGQGRPRPRALPARTSAGCSPPCKAQAPPADPVEWIRQLGVGLRALRAREPEPLPLHVHDPGEARAQARADRSRASSPSASCAPRSPRRIETGAASGPATSTRWPRCCGRASTARWRSSSRSGPALPAASAGARPGRARRSKPASAASARPPPSRNSVMVSLARKNLLHDRLRFVITVAGRGLRGHPGARAGRPLHGPPRQGHGHDRERERGHLGHLQGHARTWTSPTPSPRPRCCACAGCPESSAPTT